MPLTRSLKRHNSYHTAGRNETASQQPTRSTHSKPIFARPAAPTRHPIPNCRQASEFLIACCSGKKHQQQVRPDQTCLKNNTLQMVTPPLAECKSTPAEGYTVLLIWHANPVRPPVPWGVAEASTQRAAAVPGPASSSAACWLAAGLSGAGLCPARLGVCPCRRAGVAHVAAHPVGPEERLDLQAHFMHCRRGRRICRTQVPGSSWRAADGERVGLAGGRGARQRQDGQAVAVADLNHVAIRVMHEHLRRQLQRAVDLVEGRRPRARRRSAHDVHLCRAAGGRMRDQPWAGSGCALLAASLAKKAGACPAPGPLSAPPPARCHARTPRPSAPALPAPPPARLWW